EPRDLRRELQLLERAGFDLANALAREAEPRPDLIERVLASLDQTEAQPNDVLFARREAREKAARRRCAALMTDPLLRRRLAIGHEVSDVRVGVGGDRRVQALHRLPRREHRAN